MVRKRHQQEKPRKVHRKPYVCTVCHRTHGRWTVIGITHIRYRRESPHDTATAG